MKFLAFVGLWMKLPLWSSVSIGLHSFPSGDVPFKSHLEKKAFRDGNMGLKSLFLSRCKHVVYLSYIFIFSINCVPIDHDAV